MAASFIGWWRATFIADMSPVARVTSMPAPPTHAATFIESSAISTLRLRIIHHELTPITNTPARVHALATVCVNLATAVSEVTTPQKSAMTLRICAGSNSMPTGCCIHALAIRIHSADRHVPAAVSHVAARWNPGLNFFQPKNITAINVDSMKNATIPSMARGAPKISPTNQL